jgi:hypothetical protein
MAASFISPAKTSQIDPAIAPLGSRFNLHIKLLRRFRKIQLQRRAKPPFHVQLFRAIPIPSICILSLPIQTILVTREGRGREDYRKSVLGIWNVGYNAIDHRVCASDEGLLDQSHARIVKDPHAEVLVGRYNVDCIHCITVNRAATRMKEGSPTRGP